MTAALETAWLAARAEIPHLGCLQKLAMATAIMIAVDTGERRFFRLQDVALEALHLHRAVGSVCDTATGAQASSVTDRKTALKARHLLEGAAFGPDTLKSIFETFDSAWNDIAHYFGSDDRAVEDARTRLAYALLIVARDKRHLDKTLKNDALRIMALAYNDEFERKPQPLAVSVESSLPR